ncbi:TolC family protein [Pseudomaricurvus alkylphenolicus]|uniref:TolC family protein n=1 Tax=Pseudomaricurvus alkylphenolicus TaxID=1306991 RepID=UPI001F0F42B8|nr:TolC family protein [Pseudomaricurvus alkylphenolicus]
MRQIKQFASSGKPPFMMMFRRRVFLRRYKLLLAIAPLLIAADNLYADEVNPVVLNENSAVEVAVSDNPNLAEVQERYKALLEVPSQVGTLPDPMVSLNAMNFPTDTFDRDQEPMTQLQVGVSQVIPFPGKLGLKEEAAEYDAKAAGHSVDEVRLQLVKNVKSKWWQLYYLDRALDTVKNNQALLRQFITVAQTKYETGKGLQQDVLLAQLELSRLMDQEIQLRAIRRNQVIKLNILMDRPANDVIVLPDQVSKSMPALADESTLYLQAESSRPLLKQMETKIEAAQSRLDLAKRDYYPDFKLGVTYGDRTGDNPPPMGGSRSDFFSVMVGVKVPLYSGRKQSKAVSQRSSELQMNRYALLDEKGLVTAAISSAVTDYQEAKQQFSLYGSGIIPQAQQTVQSMLAGYQVSEVDFLNLVRSQMTLFNYELQYWKALSDAKQALARLEAAVGEESVYE